MALEIEENGIDLGAVNTAGLDEISEGAKVDFTYNADVVNVIKEVTKSNIYFHVMGDVDESVNLEVLSGVLNKLSEISESTSDVETIMSIKTLLDGGIIEFMVTARIRKRAAIYAMMKVNIIPDVIVKYMHDLTTVDESIVNLSDSDKTMVKDAINEIVKMSLDSKGTPIEVVLKTKDGVNNTDDSAGVNDTDSTAGYNGNYNTNNSAINDAVNNIFGSVFKDASEDIDEASDTASSSNAKQEETLDGLSSRPVMDFGSGNSGHSSSDGISTTGAIGIGLGVVALGAAAYFGYNCFFGDGCEDDITLME